MIVGCFSSSRHTRERRRFVMAKGDERRRRKPRPCNLFRGTNSGPNDRERREARRTEATIAARKAIGASTSEEARAIMARSGEKRQEFHRVFESLK